MNATIIIEDNPGGETVSIRTEFDPPLKDLEGTKPTMAASAALELIKFANGMKQQSHLD